MDIKKYVPYIGIGVGAAAISIGSFMVGRKAHNVKMRLYDMRINKGDKLSVKEIVSNSWKDILPGTAVAIAGAASITLGAVGLHQALSEASGAAALATAALSNYIQKTTETVGEKVAEEISKPVDIPKSENKNDKKTNTEIYVTNDVDFRCYDSVSGRYFKSNVNKIDKSINNLNRQMLRDDYITKADWFYELGLTNTEDANDKGWSAANGLISWEPRAWIDDDGAPCILVELNREARDI